MNFGPTGRQYDVLSDVTGRKETDMKVYIAAKGEPIEKAVCHEDVEKIRTFTNAWDEPVLQINKHGSVNILSLRLDLVDTWIV